MTTPSPQNPQPSAFPRLRWLAFWLLLILILLAAMVNWQTRQAWEDYVAEAKAKGDSLDPASVIPPPIPDAENFALAPVFQPLFDYTISKEADGEPEWRDPTAKKALEDLTLGTDTKALSLRRVWPTESFIDLAAWQKYFRERKDLRKAPQAGAPAEDVLLALGKFDKRISELRREAAARPRSRFPVRYEDSPEVFMPHLYVLQELGRIVDLRAVAELSLGRSPAASEDVLLSLRFAGSISEEPMQFPLSIRQLIIREALQPVWEGLVQRQWTGEQLALFDARLAEIHFAADCRAAARGERNLEFFPDLDALLNRDRMNRLLSSDPEMQTTLRRTLVFLAPTAFIEANKVSEGRWFDKVSICVDPVKNRFFPNRVRQLEAELETVPRGGSSLGSVFAQSFGYEMLWMIRPCAEAQESVNLVRVAIALERHRLRHGAYPETLEALDAAAAPNGLPGDAATEHPVHYARMPDGRFTLYYDGWNGVDDGGQMAWQGKEHLRADFTKGDWAWPWPEP